MTKTPDKSPRTQYGSELTWRWFALYPLQLTFRAACLAKPARIPATFAKMVAILPWKKNYEVTFEQDLGSL